jgi:hypothetical protein
MYLRKEESWERYILDAWCFDEVKKTIETTGEKQSGHNGVTIRIPRCGTDLDVKVGDIAVIGICELEISTVKDLKDVPFHKVTQVTKNFHGLNPHVKVVAV